MVSFRALSVLVFGLAVLPGCPNDPTTSNDLGWITTTAGAGETLIDASAADGWTYLSFANGVVAPPASPETSLDWDVAFQRYNIKTNGGSSGVGQGSVADLGPLDLATTTTAQVAGWTPDALVRDARTGQERSMNAVLSGWYEYHFFRHQLLSKYHLYAVRAADGRVGLLKIHSYYDGAGTPARLTVIQRFPVDVSEADGATGTGTSTPVADPPADTVQLGGDVVSGETNFDARAGRTWLRFTAEGLEASSTQPADGAWDLAFDLWLLQTNSGTSGTGQGGAQKVVGPFDQALEAPADGYLVDAIDTIGAEQRQESTNAALADWFEYDPTSQRIRPRDQSVWLRTHDGRFAKVRIVGYYHPDGSEAFYRLRWAYRADGGRAF